MQCRIRSAYYRENHYIDSVTSDQITTHSGAVVRPASGRLMQCPSHTISITVPNKSFSGLTVHLARDGTMVRKSSTSHNVQGSPRTAASPPKLSATGQWNASLSSSMVKVLPKNSKSVKNNLLMRLKTLEQMDGTANTAAVGLILNTSSLKLSPHSTKQFSLTCLFKHPRSENSPKLLFFTPYTLWQILCWL